MAGDHGGGDQRIHQEGQASRDFISAARDVTINQYPPSDGARSGVGDREASFPLRRSAWGDVPARNPGFTGRGELLRELREMLVSSGRAPVQVLHGRGGVGKTQIATEYAHRFGADYEVVWWIDAEEASLIGAQFAALAAELGLADADMDHDGIAVRRQILRELRERERWLLIFDNAEKPVDVSGWLPGGSGHVLITSRTQAWNEIAVPVEVDVLARSESVAILRDRVHAIPEPEADQVADALGDFPLAVVQAAAFMTGTGMSSGEYVGLLEDRAADILDEGRPSSYPLSMAAVTQLALERLRDEDPVAAAVAAMCAVMAPQVIPSRWFAVASASLPALLRERADDPMAWRQTLGRVGRSELARVDRDGLVMHRVTQGIVRGHLTPAELDSATQSAALLLAYVAPHLVAIMSPESSPDHFSDWAGVLAHAITLQSHAGGHLSLGSPAETLVSISGHLHQCETARAQHDVSTALCGQWNESLGPDDPHGVTNLSVLISTNGGVQAALAGEDAGRHLHLRAPQGILGSSRLSDAFEISSDDEAPPRLISELLAGHHRGAGDVQAAMALDRDTLSRRQQILGMDHPETLMAAHRLAVDLYLLGDHRGALELDVDTRRRFSRAVSDGLIDAADKSMARLRMIIFLG